MSLQHPGYQYCIIFILLSLLATGSIADFQEKEEQPPILIGVLANRGDEIALQEWGPTAEYLEKNLAPLHFKIIPYTFNEITNASKIGEISFVATNPSVYSYLEYHGLAQRIVNLQVPGKTKPETYFGGVIFTRSDRDDIIRLEDLKGQRFVAVDQDSLGGWQAAWKELKTAGIDPLTDFSSLRFTGNQDDSVLTVLNNDADAGTVRSSQIERMAGEGKINSSQIKVLNDMHDTYPGFPYLLSTSLYPEWPFAAGTGTDPNLSKKVATVLLEMDKDDPAAIALHGAGWAIAQDHTAVHELLKTLNLPPYDQTTKPTIQEIIKHYWQTILGIIIGVTVLSLLLIYTWKTKKDLVHALVQVRESEKALLTSKNELENVNRRLSETQERLVDSIQYGKLIQQSILPAKAELDTHLSDYLILSLPLDIVGGDFYFFKEVNDGYYIAVIDCTGHGVPGAFMTMMVNALLSRVIETHPDETPAFILNKLHILVQETLKSQSESSHLQNGLDIALCRVYPDNNRLIFSGAGLPLFVMNDGEVEEIDGEHVHLGFSSNKRAFALSNQEITINPGSRFFLVTDGVFDLPGGEKGFGLGRKGFKNLLRVIDIPLSGQKEQLYSNLIEYQNNWIQKDDILIFGFMIRRKGTCVICYN